MDKQIFKVGDRVFDIMYGWGVVEELHQDEERSYPLIVRFPGFDTLYYTRDGKSNTSDSHPILSFTEYGFDNRFTQERPINYEEYIGKWGKFWGDRIQEYIISRLERATPEGFKSNTSFILYDNFEPLTEEQIKTLNLK